jgi:uncharacterized protein with HEPN domain
MPSASGTCTRPSRWRCKWRSGAPGWTFRAIRCWLALTRTLEILGEAASRISDEARLRFTSIPYSKMVAMRNRLIHAYFDVDLDIVWTTVAEDPPRPVLESALAQLEK